MPMNRIICIVVLFFFCFNIQSQSRANEGIVKIDESTALTKIVDQTIVLLPVNQSPNIKYPIEFEKVPLDEWFGEEDESLETYYFNFHHLLLYHSWYDIG